MTLRPEDTLRKMMRVLNALRRQSFDHMPQTTSSQLVIQFLDLIS
jgi:hypothetical protein